MTLSQRQEFVRALLLCDSVFDPGRRGWIVKNLPEGIKNPIVRDGNPQIDTDRIVSACEKYPSGIERLMGIVRSQETTSQEFRAVEDVLLEIQAHVVLLPAQRREVADFAGRLMATEVGGLRALAHQSHPQETSDKFTEGDEAIVEHLAKLPPATPGRHTHPALELVERLALVAQRKGDFPAFERLREIAAAAGDVLEIGDADRDRVAATLAAEAPPAPQQLYLLLDFRGYPALPGLYEADVWLLEAGGSAPMGRDLHQGDPQPLDRLREGMLDRIDRVAGPVRTPGDRLSVEVFLPRSLRRGDFDQWPASRPNARGNFRLLGIECPVVVRCRERVEDTTAFGVRSQWWRARNALRQCCTGMQAVPIKWVSNPAEADYYTLYDALEKQKGSVCLVVVTAPPDDPDAILDDVLDAAVDTGVPWILYLRRRPVDPGVARTTLEKLLAKDPHLARLPEEVQSFRGAADRADHLGHAVSLMWDDDLNRLPPTRRLQAPGQTGTMT